CLKPGAYTIVQTTEPAGFIDGKEARGGVVLNNPPGTDTIPITLASADLPNNNFGELISPSLSGNVYLDLNNNGLKDGPEQGIAGVAVSLTGMDDLGPVNKSTTTNSSGFYQFSDLRPGTYTVTENQPANYLDGKDTIGNIPGTTTNDQFANIA